MDLNYLLVWLVCLSCGLNLYRCLRNLQTARTASGWAWVSGAILAVTILLSVYRFEIAGLTGGLAWGTFIVLPLIGLRRTNHLITQHRFRAATRLSWWVRFLHPLDGWWTYPAFFNALAQAQAGQQATALQILQPLLNEKTALGRLAYCNWFRIQGDWPGLRTWVAEDLGTSVFKQDPRLLVFYLQALGETRAISEMLETLKRWQPYLREIEAKTTWDACCLCVLAFCGQTAIVEQLLAGLWALRSRRERLYWKITAHQAAGETAAVRADCAALQATGDCLYCSSLDHRTDPVWQTAAPQLLPSEIQQLRYWSGPYLKHQIPIARSQSPAWKAPITILLVQLNVIAFVVAEIMGGSTNWSALYHLGAVVPEQVIAGEWWRLLTATFLHFGLLHIALNMLALAFLGALVERQLGPLRFLVVYLTAGVGSMLVVTLLTLVPLLGTPPDIVVGASGAVMGMIGAEAAILLRHWWQNRSPHTAMRLQRIGIIIALQTVFDLTTPQISFTGHISGLILGFMACWIVRCKSPFKLATQPNNA